MHLMISLMNVVCMQTQLHVGDFCNGLPNRRVFLITSLNRVFLLLYAFDFCAANLLSSFCRQQSRSASRVYQHHTVMPLVSSSSPTIYGLR